MVPFKNYGSWSYWVPQLVPSFGNKTLCSAGDRSRWRSSSEWNSANWWPARLHVLCKKLAVWNKLRGCHFSLLSSQAIFKDWMFIFGCILLRKYLNSSASFPFLAVCLLFSVHFWPCPLAAPPRQSCACCWAPNVWATTGFATLSTRAFLFHGSQGGWQVWWMTYGNMVGCCYKMVSAMGFNGM